MVDDLPCGSQFPYAGNAAGDNTSHGEAHMSDAGLVLSPWQIPYQSMGVLAVMGGQTQQSSEVTTDRKVPWA